MNQNRIVFETILGLLAKMLKAIETLDGAPYLEGPEKLAQAAASLGRMSPEMFATLRPSVTRGLTELAADVSDMAEAFKGFVLMADIVTTTLNLGLATLFRDDDGELGEEVRRRLASMAPEAAEALQREMDHFVKQAQMLLEGESEERVHDCERCPIATVCPTANAKPDGELGDLIDGLDLSQLGPSGRS